jgi:hypothetical protein
MGSEELLKDNILIDTNTCGNSALKTTLTISLKLIELVMNWALS